MARWMFLGLLKRKILFFVDFPEPLQQDSAKSDCGTFSGL